MPVLNFYSLAVLRMAYEAAERARSLAATAPDQTADDALVAIILAASAAEGFVNDLAAMIQFAAAVHNIPRTGDISRLTAIATTVEFLEEERGRTQAKYLAVAILTSCEHIRRGTEPFQSFDDLAVPAQRIGTHQAG